MNVRCSLCDDVLSGSGIYRVQEGGVLFVEWQRNIYDTHLRLKFMPNKEGFADGDKAKFICPKCAVGYNVDVYLLSVESCNICGNSFDDMNSAAGFDDVLQFELGAFVPSNKGDYLVFHSYDVGYAHYECACARPCICNGPCRCSRHWNIPWWDLE